jgi:hypothetical protein
VGNVQLIVVLGHASCSAAMDVAAVVSRLGSAGVSRARLDSDIRGWLGLIGPAEANVRTVAETIASHPSLPAGIAVLGLMMEESRGRLLQVCQTATRGTVAATSADVGGGGGLPVMGPMQYSRSDLGADGPDQPKSIHTDVAASSRQEQTDKMAEASLKATGLEPDALDGIWEEVERQQKRRAATPVSGAPKGKPPAKPKAPPESAFPAGEAGRVRRSPEQDGAKDRRRQP